MKYLPLVWASLWRRKPRTVLTMLSVIVAFLLYALLTALHSSLHAGVEMAGADRLVTTGRYSLTEVLPESHWHAARAVPGVENVTIASWFGGIYQDERNFFPQFPVDPESYFDIYPELVLPQEQKEAFFDTRTGAVVARTLAERFEWEVGDRVPIRSTIWSQTDGSSTWTFDIVGIFDTSDPAARSQHEYMLFHHEYFDESKQFVRGHFGWMVTRVADPEQSAEVAQAIDAVFANSAYETRTDTERAFSQSFIRQMGDFGMLIGSILGAVFFTLLFLTGNTMMQSVRERIPELAVLKTLGYRDTTVLALVLAESVALCMLAALAGLGLGVLLLQPIAANLPGFSAMEMSAGAAAMGVGLAALLALVVGMPPALRAMRLNIVDALGGH